MKKERRQLDTQFWVWERNVGRSRFCESSAHNVTDAVRGCEDVQGECKEREGKIQVRARGNTNI